MSVVSSSTMQILDTGGPTHFSWLNDHVSTAIDFAVYRGIPCSHLSISECSSLSPDHIPLLIYFSVAAYQVISKTRLLPRSSDIRSFSFTALITHFLSLRMTLIPMLRFW